MTHTIQQCREVCKVCLLISPSYPLPFLHYFSPSVPPKLPLPTLPSFPSCLSHISLLLSPFFFSSTPYFFFALHLSPSLFISLCLSPSVSHTLSLSVSPSVCLSAGRLFICLSVSSLSLYIFLSPILSLHSPLISQFPFSHYLLSLLLIASPLTCQRYPSCVSSSPGPQHRLLLAVTSTTCMTYSPRLTTPEVVYLHLN